MGGREKKKKKDMVTSDLFVWKVLNKHDNLFPCQKKPEMNSVPFDGGNVSTAQQSPIVFSSDIQNKLVCLPEGIHPKIN